ncbi:hypothetical protein BU195_28630 (plasmid) [Klebsiella pneumoniae subsp. pneumoniae]|nr:hypothetical protein BU195_28630 [Klebsiella pneumoniae subsp. pneumoniae]
METDGAFTLAAGISVLRWFPSEVDSAQTAFIQPQTVLPAFIRKFFRFITGTIFRLPASQPASLYFLTVLFINLVLASLGMTSLIVLSRHDKHINLCHANEVSI